MENRLGERITALGDRVHKMEEELSDRITRLETVIEPYSGAQAGQAGASGRQ